MYRVYAVTNVDILLKELQLTHLLSPQLVARIEDYILGRFQRESVDAISATSGSAVTLEDLDLLPNLKSLLLQKDWPYVKQVYHGGRVTCGRDVPHVFV